MATSLRDTDFRPGPAREPRRQIEILFIAGVGRSGTTLLTNMLGQHPDIEAVGESQYIWDRGLLANDLCGCGVRFHHCDFWREVGMRAFGDWDEVDAQLVLTIRDEVDRNRHIPLLVRPSISEDFRRKLDRYVEVLGALFQGIAETSGNDVVVDSSKHASFAYVLRHVADTESRTVLSIRDSRGVAHSWCKSVQRHEVVDETSFMPQFRPSSTAAQWALTDLLLRPLPLLGVPVMDMLYEDMVENPWRECSRILDFAGIRTHRDLPFIGKDWVDLAPTHTVSGNNSRFTTGRVPLVLDSEWRTAMKPRDRRTVTALTWPLLRKRGYA